MAARMMACKECGRMYDANAVRGVTHPTDYCSANCERAAKAAREARSAPRPAAQAAPKRSYSSGSSGVPTSSQMKLIIPIIVILIIIGLIGTAVNGIRNAFSSVKIDIVSASCETEEKFVSIVKEALSGVSGTTIEGEEFTAYSQQAHDAVKKREGEYGLFKDSLYFVRLPDSVNAYIWFKTEDQIKAYVYKTE